MESAVVGTANESPTVAFIYFAYADVAMYDAVNSIDGRFRPFAVTVDAPRGASKDAAAATAAHDVLVHYFSPPLASVDQTQTLDSDLAASLSALPNDQATTDGIRVGRQVAVQWLALRAGDGLKAPVVFPLPTPGPGIWEPVPMLPVSPVVPPPVAPWQAQFKPFVLPSADHFLARVPPPSSLTSATFTRNFNQVKSYGALNSDLRTAQQTEIAKFWTDNPAAQYSRALRVLIANHHLDTAEAARLGAMSFVALADAGTACMNAKYHFAFWRPYTAIRDAGTDGNPKTVADPTWVQVDVTPGHPEYPSNHACITEALMDTLTEFFQTDEIPYTVTSNATMTTHNFDSFEDVVREVDNARIWGGMHFRYAIKQGNRLGRRVANYILEHQFGHKDDE
jgi:hypothetical protein